MMTRHREFLLLLTIFAVASISLTFTSRRSRRGQWICLFSYFDISAHAIKLKRLSNSERTSTINFGSVRGHFRYQQQQQQCCVQSLKVVIVVMQLFILRVIGVEVCRIEGRFSTRKAINAKLCIILPLEWFFSLRISMAYFQRLKLNVGFPQY